MEFVTYRKFTETAQRNELVSLLNAAGIMYDVTEQHENLEVLYGSKQFSKEFFVKIKPADFAAVDALLAEEARKALSSIASDHYLFSFTDEELFDVLVKPDEWSELDYQLARKILIDRKRDISDDTLELLKKQRIAELAKPEESQKIWIYGGYIMALLGGLIGILIGWHMAASKKTLPNGQVLYTFKQADRQHGWRIVLIGAIMFMLYLIIRVDPLYWELSF